MNIIKFFVAVYINFILYPVLLLFGRRAHTDTSKGFLMRGTYYVLEGEAPVGSAIWMD
jgi:hypothetical protein